MIQLSKYRYATKVRCKGGPYDGRVAVKAGKQQKETETIRFVVDSEVKAYFEERLEVFELPERMTEEEVQEWVSENSDDGLLDVLEKSTEDDS